MLELYIVALNSDSAAQIVAVALSNEGGSSRGRAGAASTPEMQLFLSS